MQNIVSANLRIIHNSVDKNTFCAVVGVARRFVCISFTNNTQAFIVYAVHFEPHQNDSFFLTILLLVMPTHVAPLKNTNNGSKSIRASVAGPYCFLDPFICLNAPSEEGGSIGK